MPSAFANSAMESRGEEPSTESVNTVHDTPEAFDKWVRDHADKIKTSKSVPYFIRDNQQRVDRVLGKQKTPQEIAKERHAARTPGDATGRVANGDITGKLRVIPESECNFTLPNGGSISTPPKRLSKGNYNKQEQGKFEKELRMANRFANGGHKIEFAADDAASFDVLIDGVKARISNQHHRLATSSNMRNTRHANKEQTSCCSNLVHGGLHILRQSTN